MDGGKSEAEGQIKQQKQETMRNKENIVSNPNQFFD